MLSLVLGAVTMVAGLPAGAVSRPVTGMEGFDPSFIISDEIMDDSSTMTAAQIQEFLNTRGANCSRGTDGSACLKNAVFTSDARPATPYCAAMSGGTNESSASYIHRVSQACGINPQVLLVMLQKEQSLITTANPTETNYLKSMGFRCPDFQSCEPQYAGFPNQVYSAASRLNEYRESPDRFRDFTFHVGNTYNVLLNPNASCGTWRLPMRSAATAALYNYTPYTPNVAALDNPGGTGDSCSAYGNRNFYRNFTLWFGSPNRHGAALGNSRFLDVGTTPFVAEIQWLAASGITNGWSDGTYRPYNSLTRGETAAFLYRVAGRPAYTAPASSSFRDVPTSHAFYKEIHWMRSRGITTGWSDGTFRPGEAVLRDQLAAFLYRFAGAGATSTSSGFSDVPSSRVFAKEITWLSSNGITTGWDDGTFRPYETVLRDQFAAFINRFDTRF